MTSKVSKRIEVCLVLIIISVIDLIMWHFFNRMGRGEAFSTLLTFATTCFMWSIYLKSDPFGTKSSDED